MCDMDAMSNITLSIQYQQYWSVFLLRVDRKLLQREDMWYTDTQEIIAFISLCSIRQGNINKSVLLQYNTVNKRLLTSSTGSDILKNSCHISLLFTRKKLPRDSQKADLLVSVKSKHKNNFKTQSTHKKGKWGSGFFPMHSSVN